MIVVNFLRAPCDDVATATCYSKIPQKNEKWVLAATILGSSMAFIDGTIVNVALPALQNAFQASVNQVQWVVEAYALSLATLLLLGGALGDIYGRRIIFLIGVLLFAGASIWCGLTQTILQLIVARLFQGVGAALLVPGSLALISASFPEDRRGKAIGTWSGFTAIMAGIGPVVGGWLVQHASWRWIFFLNLPLALAVALITLLRVPESKNKKLYHQLDITGSFLITLGLGAIVYGLIQWGQGGYIIPIMEALGICALLGFIFVEAHSRSPMIPLDMFRVRNFTAANLLTFFPFKSHSSARLQCNAGRCSAASINFINLFIIKMGWRISQTFWLKVTAYRRTGDCRTRFCSISWNKY
jgi:EmrB/QacA subfamily drug resistance transporter